MSCDRFTDYTRKQNVHGLQFSILRVRWGLSSNKSNATEMERGSLFYCNAITLKIELVFLHSAKLHGYWSPKKDSRIISAEI